MFVDLKQTVALRGQNVLKVILEASEGTNVIQSFVLIGSKQNRRLLTQMSESQRRDVFTS